MNAVLTVSQLNRYMAFKIKEDIKLRGVLIKGEISGFSHHRPTGHFYFTLKEGGSAVRAVMFNSFASRLGFMPENGMSVIVMGSIQVFERDGVYQLYATDIQPDGLGAAYLAFEQLKERLSAEGLFDEIHKKPLPAFPSRVGIVTAKGGAALQDILNILARRYPLCEAVIFGCLVQGEYAPSSICEALETADRSGCDVIICGRGGGSPEELAAFNSESVARTAFAMNTPLISAVGHETDTTIIDFVSDLRAPTPSAAAELAVPDIPGLLSSLGREEKMLANAFIFRLEEKKHRIRTLAAALKGNSPDARISAVKEKTLFSEKALGTAMEHFISMKKALISEKAAQLDALSPLKIMTRGYALVYSGERLVRSAEDTKSGDKICIKFSDGEKNAVIC